MNVGDACVFPEAAAPANCADPVISRPSTMFMAKYGAIFIMSPEGQAALHLRRTGNAQPHFNIGAMSRRRSRCRHWTSNARSWLRSSGGSQLRTPLSPRLSMA